ncbi:MAG: DMT family transporter [Burkholderiaceae bacterium]|nr:DMT family transporter [Burkholderiaceae bacterium]
MKHETKGMLVGFIGIFIFSLTLPVTKIAVEILNPYFLCFARALLAGILAGAYLIYTKAPIPDAKQIRQFAIVALGVVFVFPLFINIAMTTGEASHAGVILGIMPLATVVAGVLLFQERPSLGFWISALTGCAIVCTYAYLNSEGGFRYTDLLLLIACAANGIAYAIGGNLSRTMNAKQVISWTLVLSLPINLLGSAFTFQESYFMAGTTIWISFLYLGIFSMFVGFFFWYGGMAIGGISRVSQVQLLQPFCTLLASAILVSEPITLMNILFAGLVITTVMIGRQMLVRRAQTV